MLRFSLEYSMNLCGVKVTVVKPCLTNLYYITLNLTFCPLVIVRHDSQLQRGLELAQSKLAKSNRYGKLRYGRGRHHIYIYI